MKTLISIGVFVLIFTPLFSQTSTFGDEEQENYYVFGLRIIPNGSSVGQYFILYAPNDQIKSMEPISTDEFIRFSKGMNVSKPNPDKKNLLADNGVQDWRTVEQVWKVRYAKYPYGSRIDDTTVLKTDSLGWTNNFISPYVPRPEQMDILETYGLKTINGYVFGDNLFRLLKDMEDPQWISRYRQAGANNDND